MQNPDNIGNSSSQRSHTKESTNVLQNISDNLDPQTQPIPQLFLQHPEVRNIPQHGFSRNFPIFPEPGVVSPKRMSYISSALEKRKIFFSGKQGSDPLRFIEYLKECATTMAITDGEIYNSLPVVLHGEALDWFRLNKNNFPTLEQFFQALISQYCVKNF